MRTQGRKHDHSRGRSAAARPAGPEVAVLHALHRTAGNAAVSWAFGGASQVRRTDGAPMLYGGTLAVQRMMDGDLRKARTPEEIVAALEKSGHSRDDAWELMRHMMSQQFPAGAAQGEFDILDSIKPASKERIRPVHKAQAAALLAKPWTIRHYTGRDPRNPPSFTEIASTYDNAAAGRASEHTNVADWRSLGNIKFTFYLVAVDGKVPPRNWLNNTHWYAEWDLEGIEDCWVSPDLLETMSKPMDADGAREAMKGVKAFRGTGKELKELLAVKAFGSGNDPAAALDTAIGGAFELKVPGGLPVKEWKKK
ncbi:hypothetical protein [Streptomyces sp. AV19]|uniref:hypothetical protein n=1 Tax=Streptomyces sp. AV19 TaxID=2793068 RepID=UPI001F33DA9F|nr:hypothetical protein [Streptomyces sp. AV19]MDG4536252.1 hypothetical protein [Streptomyces sp. AV19]